MTIDERKLCLHDYNSMAELTDEELSFIVEDLSDPETVPEALMELYGRRPQYSLASARKILFESLGDPYLQAFVVSYLFDVDKDDLVEKMGSRIEHLNYYVLASFLDCLSVESLQPFGREIPCEYLRELVTRIDRLDTKERLAIGDSIEWFLKSYSFRGI